LLKHCLVNMFVAEEAFVVSQIHELSRLGATTKYRFVFWTARYPLLSIAASSLHRD